jgi:hypothetical protein
MLTVVCPSCRNSIGLPEPLTAAVYTCPHCRQPISAPAPRRSAPPKPAAFEFDTENEDDAESAPRPPRRRLNASPVGDFLVFRLMVTPLIIQIVFWIGVLVCFGVGGRMIAEAVDTEGPMKRSVSVTMLASGAAVALVGPLLWRVYCELAIIFFKIHDELKEANDRKRYRS